MTISRFLPGFQPSVEPQQPQGKGRALPPLSSSHAKKKQCLNDQPPKAPSDTPSKTPPQLSNGITIREPVAESPFAVQVGGKATSSSQPVVPWQPTFKLGKRPLPATATRQCRKRTTKEGQHRAQCTAYCYPRTFASSWKGMRTCW